MVNNQRIQLDPRFDKSEEIYFIGKLKAPILIDMNEGVTYLVFLSESGEEELQIATNDKENTAFSKYSIYENKMKIKLDKREDKDGQVFYVCKVKHPGLIRCSSETCFLAFVSRKGQEELQITGEFINEFSKPVKKEIEVIKRKSYE